MTWMTAIRDHPERPALAQVHVLYALALRMDWQTGCGFASNAQLAADAQCGERTVRSATGWARKAELLVQTRRGHRITADRVIASEWRLAIPGETQPATLPLLTSKPTGNGMPIGSKPTGKWERPNRQMEPTQPARTAPPSELGPQDLVPSANGDGAKAPRPPSADPETRGPAPASLDE